MTRKIIIDCDPGIDDAVALCIALFDPRLDVLAITATAGTVDAAQATNNVSAILGQLDPPRYPRVGKASAPGNAAVVDDRHLNGSDGLGNGDFQTPDRQHQVASDKVIAALLRKHPGEVTLVCLGPLTNIARLCQRDSSAVPLIDKIVISGGSIHHPGNATPAAEWNCFFDAQSASEVFESATTKSVVPLDVTESVKFGVQLLEQLPPRYTRAGALLQHVLTFAFRAAHQKLGRELISLYDATTMLAVLEPDLFKWKGMAGKVETRGELTQGMTVFDRRMRPKWPMNMEVAVDVDAVDAREMVIRSLRYAGQQG